MRNILLPFVMMLLFCTCKKESVFDKSGFSGEGTALLNGMPGQVRLASFTDVYCEPDTCIGIKMLYYEDGALRGDITINHIPLSPGKKTLNYVWPLYERINAKMGIQNGQVTEI